MRILVCDDLPDDDATLADTASRGVPQHVELHRLCGGQLKECITQLIAEANEVLESEATVECPASDFDDADIIVVDNNLAHLAIDGVRLTAEAIIGYIRSFSSAPYIVSVNKNPDVDFDLRYLIGDYPSKADLAVNESHLAEPALWARNKETVTGDFLPWYWPSLTDAARTRRHQIQNVCENLNEPLLRTLKFDSDSVDALTRQARSILSQAAVGSTNGEGEDEFVGVTFLDVFRASNRSLAVKSEREALERKLDDGALGIRHMIARAIAADIDFWFRRDVLGPQNVLVDVPHLVMRMPFLLGDRANDVEAWNATANVTYDGAPFGLDQTLYDEHLKSALYSGTQWVSRPCLWWDALRDNENLNACLLETSGEEWPDVVFCEDVSEFRPFEQPDGSHAAEFVTQLEGAWNRRYVANLDGWHYVPRTRLAM